MKINKQIGQTVNCKLHSLLAEFDTTGPLSFYGDYVITGQHVYFTFMGKEEGAQKCFAYL